MPKLTRTVDDIETVDAAFRPLYVKNEGGDGYVLDPDQVEGVEDTKALKGALQKERDANAAYKKLKKALGSDDVDPDEIAQLVKAARTAGGEKGTKGRKDADEEVDRLLQKREKEVRDELAPEIGKVKTLEAQVRSLTIGTTVRTAAAKAGIFKTALDDAEALSSKYLDVKDGKVIVLDDDGDPTGTSVEKFFASKFKELKPHLYEGTGSSGSDAEKSTKKGGAADGASKSATDKIAAGLAARSTQR